MTQSGALLPKKKIKHQKIFLFIFIDFNKDIHVCTKYRSSKVDLN